MSEEGGTRKHVVDWLTLIAIAAIAISLNVAMHEGVHALTCLAVGGDLQEYSALYVECDSPSEFQAKTVAGSAPTVNLIAGTILWLLLRQARKRSPETRIFLWLFMLMNWFYGAGYLIFSGIADIGDWAVVIRGWEPVWLWRIAIIILGTVLYLLFIRQGLREIGGIVGGDADEQVHAVRRLGVISYGTSIGVVLLAGLFCPHGFLGLPVTAGLFGVAGGLSPFLVMSRWFRTGSFEKPAREATIVHRNWAWIVAAVVVIFTYAFVLGRTIYF